MKTLYLLRHAKSSWKYQDLSDFERPLSSRGRRDAPFMGKLMQQRGILPEHMVSSPATRAITTARQLADAMGYSSEDIEQDRNIYEAGNGALIAIIQKTDDKFGSLMLAGHNPAITTVAERLSGASIDNIVTCGIVQIDFQLDSWAEIDPDKGQFIFFEFPRKYLK